VCICRLFKNNAGLIHFIRFIYTLFLALDACFRLKRGLISSELKDPGLGTGMSYMLENVPYREYLLGVTDQKEVRMPRRRCLILMLVLDEYLQWIGCPRLCEYQVLARV
jgi:hypothetical protein